MAQTVHLYGQSFTLPMNAVKLMKDINGGKNQHPADDPVVKRLYAHGLIFRGTGDFSHLLGLTKNGIEAMSQIK